MKENQETNIPENHLLDLLVYDSEVKPVFSLPERIKIHEARVALLPPKKNSYLQNFEAELLYKMLRILEEIKIHEWSNPEYFYLDMPTGIKKTYKNKNL